MAERIVATCPIFECARRGTYWVAATCATCTDPFEVELTKGHDIAHGVDCPQCGNKSVFGHKFLREGQQRG